MIHYHRKQPNNERKKPIFYCPSHKVGNIHFPFKEDDIFECIIPGCFCGNICGWVATCGVCGRVIHNCIHGCKKGIPLLHRRTPIKSIKIGDLAEHYNLNHQGFPVYLYYQCTLQQEENEE